MGRHSRTVLGWSEDRLPRCGVDAAESVHARRWGVAGAMARRAVRDAEGHGEGEMDGEGACRVLAGRFSSRSWTGDGKDDALVRSTCS